MRTARWSVTALALALAVAGGARADVVYHKLIMVGDPDGTPPDDPSYHVDPNTAGSPYAGVGAVRANVSGGGYYLGSGALITPYHVLTAAHLLDVTDDGVIDFAPSAVSFYINNAATPTVVGASALVIHPDYTGFDNPSVNDDLAIITLSAAAPAGVPIYPLYQSVVATGTQTIQVGYGRSGDGVNGYTVSASLTVKRFGANVVDARMEDDEGAPGNGIWEVWEADFDGPTADTNLMGGLTLGNTIETGLGPGDSGGPSFVEIEGQLYLIGNNTFGFNEEGGAPFPLFGTGLGGILVEPYLDWIDGEIPEPGTLGLVAVGLAAVAARRRRPSGR